jgi:hypothetical protein
MQPVVDVRTGWRLISQFLEARGLFGQPLLKCLLMFDALALDGQWSTAPAL